jgi:hypothetical protein
MSQTCQIRKSPTSFDHHISLYEQGGRSGESFKSSWPTRKPKEAKLRRWRHPDERTDVDPNKKTARRRSLYSGFDFCFGAGLRDSRQLVVMSPLMMSPNNSHFSPLKEERGEPMTDLLGSAATFEAI